MFRALNKLDFKAAVDVALEKHREIMMSPTRLAMHPIQELPQGEAAELSGFREGEGEQGSGEFEQGVVDALEVEENAEKNPVVFKEGRKNSQGEIARKNIREKRSRRRGAIEEVKPGSDRNIRSRKGSQRLEHIKEEGGPAEPTYKHTSSAPNLAQPPLLRRGNANSTNSMNELASPGLKRSNTQQALIHGALWLFDQKANDPFIDQEDREKIELLREELKKTDPSMQAVETARGFRPPGLANPASLLLPFQRRPDLRLVFQGQVHGVLSAGLLLLHHRGSARRQGELTRPCKKPTSPNCPSCPKSTIRTTPSGSATFGWPPSATVGSPVVPMSLLPFLLSYLGWRDVTIVNFGLFFMLAGALVKINYGYAETQNQYQYYAGSVVFYSAAAVVEPALVPIVVKTLPPSMATGYWHAGMLVNSADVLGRAASGMRCSLPIPRSTAPRRGEPSRSTPTLSTRH